MSGIKKNRELLTGGKKYIQQKAKKHLVEEVTFDKASRQEYLTGFHKRKVQRQKKAQEYHKEQDRLFRIEERKRIRDERKRDAEEEERRFNESIKNVKNFKGFGSGKGDGGDDEDGDEDEDDEDDWTEDVKITIKEDGEWRGFSETPKEDSDSEDESEEEQNNERPLKGILHHTEVYKQDPSLSTPHTSNGNGVIIDDETTVTIESLDNPNTYNLEEAAKQNNVNLEKSEQILEKSIQRAKNYAVMCGVAKPTPAKNKKKFRYLSKTERKDNLRKEKSKAKKRGKKL
ncbi:Ribosomal RNA-processing protein 17 [Candida viswanathii]|uniref:Ribosomal RNA-processing protein 17 n=1 Tax=Candida viswanathii TaxID=5486 RepID=A0A367YDJ9_9ASCO|nr:Ribosomal RNA-processing protein 17 [Candida viswanathii]